MAHLRRETIENIAPYVAGSNAGAIGLDSNENPRGPSAYVQNKIKEALSHLNRYPDGSAASLKKRLVHQFGVNPSQLCIGNGSNELINLLVQAFCKEGDAIALSRYAFIAYHLAANSLGIQIIEGEVDSEFRADLKDLLSLIQSNENIRLVFIPNPNNPTGTYHAQPELEFFLKEVAQVRSGSVVVVLDYAYWEYVEAPDLPNPLPFLNVYPNLVILRTFSKIYGLASLRVGYSLSSPEITEALNKIRQPFNVNGLALLAAEAALDDPEYVHQCRNENSAVKEYFVGECKKLGIPTLPSQTNFVLIDTQVGFGKTGNEIQQICLQKGVAIRSLQNYGLTHHVRVTLGSFEQMRELVRIFKNFWNS